MSEVKPIILTYDNGDEYVLEFSREAVRRCEADGFNIDDLEEKLMTRLPQLFRWAFFKNHSYMTQQKTDKILFEDMGGINEGLMERLVELYAVPYNTLIREDAAPKNSKLTVKL